MENNKKHGLSNTRLYHTWNAIKFRCDNKNSHRYKSYGGRGIKLCDEWRYNVKEFCDWAIKNGYTDKLTIDRIDVNGNYEPSNCRWVSVTENNRNRTNNRYITYKGKTQILVLWAEELGISPITLTTRYRLGWSTEKAFNQKVRKRSPNKQ